MMSGYLENLSDLDLLILAEGSGLVDTHRAAARFRSDTALVLHALNQPGILKSTFRGHASPGTAATVDIDGLRVEPSSFLWFSLVVNDRANSLVTDSLRADVIGDRMFRRFPTADSSPEPAAVAVDHSLRLFLVELLDSFTVSRSTRSWNAFLPPNATRPIDERSVLDLVGLLSVVDEETKVGVYRRLGDLALFQSALGFSSPRDTRSGAGRSHPLAIDVFGADGIAHIAAALPSPLQREHLRGELFEVLSNMTEQQLHVELGPIWYRTAVHQMHHPLMGRTLISIADCFDDARAFLQRLEGVSPAVAMPSPFVMDTNPQAFR